MQVAHPVADPNPSQTLIRLSARTGFETKQKQRCDVPERYSL